MIRVSKLGDYAIVLMATIAREAAGQAATARALSAVTTLPVPTVSKVLKALARDGLLVSQRGKAGGYSLARPAADISVAAIVTAIDGPIGLTDCSSDDPVSCGLEVACPCRQNWKRINSAVREALEGVRLDAMVPPASGPATGGGGQGLAAEGSLVRRPPKRGRSQPTKSQGVGEVKP